MSKGRFIVIEGTDGSGKATQLSLLKKKLVSEGIPVETADFPQYYETFFGQMVGRFLKGEYGQLAQVNPYLASLLYAGDRWQAKEKMSKWLDEGKVVVSNRYTTTSMAFQAVRVDEANREDFLSWLDELEYEVYGIPREDVVIFLHVPVEIGQKLLDKKGERGYVGGNKKDINERDVDYQKKTEAMYLKLAKDKNWIVLECCDGEGNLMDSEEIHELVYNKLKEREII